ncbi:MAG: PKD domain-containing protein, partial [Phycisphaera sp.]
GLTVAGTSTNPVIYVTSSDFRIGAGPGGGNGDVNLDTNSGIITRFTWNGSSWEVVDIVRGLPRSEENHATNGLEFATINGTDYLLVASGGHTNAGGPSVNFVFQCEYALSGAVLSVNLDMIEGMPILNDSGRSYIYDLPTLDDPTRANANGITDPDTPGYNGIDINDPWGGNDGLNQAIVDPSGPVQIYSPGYRNAYDVVLTESGALYATDNGANGGWGGFPVNEGGGSATNAYDPTEPGSQSPSGGEQIDNVDHLQLITTNIQTYTPGSLYGGHPNPTRANPNGAGLFTDNGTTQVFRTLIYDPDGSTPGSTTDPSIGLPANWPPVQTANAVEGDWRGPTVTNPDGPEDNPVTIWGTNTNGIDEYTASNFGGAMQGDLLAGHN